MERNVMEVTWKDREIKRRDRKEGRKRIRRRSDGYDIEGMQDEAKRMKEKEEGSSDRGGSYGSLANRMIGGGQGNGGGDKGECGGRKKRSKSK